MPGCPCKRTNRPWLADGSRRSGTDHEMIAPLAIIRGQPPFLLSFLFRLLRASPSPQGTLLIPAGNPNPLPACWNRVCWDQPRMARFGPWELAVSPLALLLVPCVMRSRCHSAGSVYAGHNGSVLPLTNQSPDRQHASVTSTERVVIYVDSGPAKFPDLTPLGWASQGTWIAAA